MEHTKEVISNLKFICKIKKGDKINTKFMYLQPDGIATKVSRSIINIDNRQNTLTFVQNTIKGVFELLEQYEKNKTKEESEKAAFNLLVEDLEESRIGISHLRGTYCDDVKFCCDIDVLLQNIDVRLGSMGERFKDSNDRMNEDKDSY